MDENNGNSTINEDALKAPAAPKAKVSAARKMAEMRAARLAKVRAAKKARAEARAAKKARTEEARKRVVRARKSYAIKKRLAKKGNRLPAQDAFAAAEAAEELQASAMAEAAEELQTSAMAEAAEELQASAMAEVAEELQASAMAEAAEELQTSAMAEAAEAAEESGAAVHAADALHSAGGAGAHAASAHHSIKLGRNAARRARARAQKAAGKKKRAVKPGTHRKLKLCIGIAVALALCGSGLGIGLMFMPGEGFVVNEGYGSVSYVVAEGETFSPEKNYSGLDIFGRLNWTFQQKDEWYSSYQGYVYTTVDQDVKTVKQFKDGCLISTDISTSSLVNVAREFCYIPSADRVIWREAAGGPSTYDGFNTPWKQGEPVGNMTISGPDGFKAKNGLPATELSVYVFQEDTILGCEPVTDNGDGTYTITYHMNPEVWQSADGSTEGAAAYYSNQMKFTGGLTDVPTFESIDISFTFNEKWENLKTEAHEVYSATMGFTVGCKADGVTEYSYDTPYLPLTNAYEEYFKEYAQKEATGAPEPTLDGMSALASAFSPVLNGPSTLELDLEVGGKPVRGIIYIDLHTGGGVPSFSTQEDINNFIDNLEVRAQIGTLRLQVDPAVKQKDGATGEMTVVTPAAAYLNVGDLNLKLTIPELMDLLGGLLGGETAESTPPAEAEDGGSNPLNAIMDAELIHEKGSGKASAHADLDLGGLSLPIDFNYFVNETNLTASLDNVHTSFTVADIPVTATLGFTQEGRAPSPMAHKERYVELAGHVKNILALIGSGNLHADIAYEGYGLKVDGDVDLTYPTSADGDLTEEQKQARIRVNAVLTVTRNGETASAKTVRIAYENGIAYLDLDGVKLSADVDKAAALVKKFLAKDEDKHSDADPDADGTGDTGFSIPKLVDTLLFTKTLTDNIAVSGDSDALQAVINVTELIKAFGFDLGSLDLSDLTLGIAGESIAVSSEKLGASLTVVAGTGVSVEEKDGYTDLMRFVDAVSAVTESGYVGAAVDYNRGGLHVSGQLQLDITSLVAEGAFTIEYQKLSKTIGIAYLNGDGNDLCLSVDGLKLKVDAKKGIEIIKSILGTEDPDAPKDDNVEKIISALFSFHLGDLIAVTDENDTLTLTLNGTELIEAFGVKFDLGSVALTVGDEIRAEADGIELTLWKGGKFTPNGAGYTDLTPVLEKLPAILNAKTLSLGGKIALVAGKAEEGKTQTEIALTVQEGYISWTDGIDVYLDLLLGVGGTEQNIFLRVTGTDVQLAYSGIGVQVYYKDLSGLEKALLDVYARVRTIVQDTLGAETENPLPEISGFGDIMDLLQSSALLAEATEETVEKGKDFDWTELVNSITIGASEEEGGIAHLEYSGLSVDILSELEDGLIGLKLGFETKSVTVNGALHTAVYTGEIPEMPEIDYLGAEEIADLIDYLGAAIGLISQNNLTLTLTGTVASEEEKYADYGGIKSNIAATVEYQTSRFPLSLDVDGKHLVVDPDVYLHISFAMTSPHPDDSDMELDITVVDADKEGKQDDILDFYITASTVGSGNAGYKPLKLYAPADEVMTLLSGVCAMFGVDVDILNDYMIGKWLSAESVGELKGLGDSLKTMLAGITGVGPVLEKIEGVIGTLNGLKDGLSGLGSLFGGKDEAAAASEGQSADAKKGGYITALELSKATAEAGGTFTFSLDGNALFGEGCDDLIVTLKKSAGEAGSTLLTSLSINNIYGKKGTEKTDISLDIGTETVSAQTPAIDGYFNVEAVDTLILSLARSATHGEGEDGTVYTGEEAPHHYALNTNFYINGSATLNLLGDATKIDIRVIAISVNLDENGKVGINLRLEYDGLYMGLAGLLGDSEIIKGDTTLDVTIKESPRAGEGLMLYMKRTQTSEFSGGTLGHDRREISPIVIYRALPLSNFMANYMDHICFMFNLSQTVVEKIMGMVGSGGSSGGASDTTPTDLGAYFDQFVKSCSYAKTEAGDTWTLEANGEGLTGSSSFKKMQIAVTADADGYLRGIAADLDIAGAVTIHADLKWRNPGGKMDPGVRDTTTDVAETLEDTMSRKLQNVDWKQEQYLDAQILIVRYYLAGREEPIGEQTVAYDPKTKEFYSTLVRPDLTPYLSSQPGYTPSWDDANTTMGSTYYDITAKYHPNDYHLVFESEERIPNAGERGYDEEYVEAEGKWLYKREWTYGDDIELPFGENNEKRIDYFECMHKHHYVPGESLTLHIYTDETVTFTAHWEYIEYKVEFVADGSVVKTVTGHYNEKVTPPTEEENPTKTGYTFERWDNVPDTFTDKNTVQVHAVFKANTYEVTILSDYDIPEGNFSKEFVKAENSDGKYAWTLTFTYGEKYALPRNVECGDYILQGFKRAGDDNLYYDYLPGDVLGTTTFTAVWDVRGVKVHFDGTDVTLDRKVGTEIARSAMPAVPEQKGYTGRWKFDGDIYTVTGEATIEAEYTPITYVIYQYSLYPLKNYEANGFTCVEGAFVSEGVKGNAYYVRKLLYVYGSNKVTLENGETLANHAEGVFQHGYDFNGFYTKRFGEGVAVSEINDSTIENVFGWNVGDVETDGLEGKNVIYANWVDNSVTVYLYSDYKFSTDFAGYNGSSGQEGNLVYAGLTLYDHNYSIADLVLNDLREDTDLQQFGLWYKNADGAWENISDIERFMQDDRNGSPAKLYVMWIEKLRVTIESLAVNTTAGTFMTYDISGVATGGAPMGDMSGTIFSEANLTKTVTGVYRIYTVKGVQDNLASGKQIAIGADGKISEHALNSANAQFSGGADFAGIVATITFESADKKLKLSTSWDAIVSIATYKVRVMDGEKVLKEADVRIDCPFDDYDNATYVSDIVKGVEPDAREHYTGWTWDRAGDEPITGAMDIYTVWSPKTYEVTFVSDDDLGEGWVKDGEYDSKYVHKEFLNYGAKITFWALGEQFGDTFIVSGDPDKDVFTLPAKKKFQDTVDGEWQFNITKEGAQFTVVYELDTINYASTVTFTYNDTQRSTFTEQFNAATAPEGRDLITPTAAGYVFLGWYEKTESGWKKVERVAASADGETRTINVEALWMEELVVDSFITSRQIREEGVLFKTSYYTYRTTLTYHGGALVGAMMTDPALQIEKTESLNYYIASGNQKVEDGQYYKGTGNSTDPYTDTAFSDRTKDVSADSAGRTVVTWSSSEGKSKKYSYGFVDITLTYSISALDGFTYEAVAHGWDLDVANGEVNLVPNN